MTNFRGRIPPRLRGLRRGRDWAILSVLAVLLALIPVLASAGPCDPPVTNPIVCENSKPGNPASEWDVSGAGESSIQGFTTDISADQGQTVQFKVDTDASSYRLDIYRMGYYGGNGARKVATVLPSAPGPSVQPECLSESSTGLIDCGNWAVSASWQVPADAVSGIYFAKLVRMSGPAGASHAFFIVRDDDGRSDLLLQTSDTTWHAYNNYGGNSLYTGQPAGRAYKVSYNRPFVTRGLGGGASHSFVFNAEYPMVRWLERNGYHVSYFTGVDTDRRGSELLEHKAFLSVGHDEYWSGNQRSSVEAARAAGVHLAFFSANEVFWKTRWEPAIDGSGASHRTLVSYKETAAGAKIDPNPAWTGTWRDPRFSPPSDGGRPENALTGTIFTVNGIRTDALQVPAADGKMRFWRNTSVAGLAPGQVATFQDGTLGYEWDEDLDNGSRPTGIVRMSSATYSLSNQYLLDHGSSYGAGVATHHLVLYRHASGALVFGAGTVQWPWGLDASHDHDPTSEDVRMQQATLNLFADMGVQPGSRQANLAASSPSTDSTKPVSTVSSPTNGSAIPSGSQVTVSGTAADSGGGVVGGVEVSVDNGATWHPVNGRESWTYSWVTGAAGTAVIKTRAVDDSGNLEAPGPGVTVTVSGSRTCPCSLWSDATTPVVSSHSDTAAVELGVKFRPDADGFITALRFYKGTTNTGTHTGHLWSASGSLLASATFGGESPTGWQQVALGAPVAVSANTTYVASYHAPNGGYARDTGYFSTAFINAPLRALADGAEGGNGVYKYGSAGSFPNETFGATNYWVDVVYSATATDTGAPGVSSTTPAPGASGVAPSTNVAAAFNEAIASSSLAFALKDPANAAVGAVVTYDAGSRTATLNPNADLAQGTTYTASVSASDLVGNAMPAPHTWSFSTGTTTVTGFPSSTVIQSGTLRSGSSASLASDNNVYYEVNATLLSSYTASWYGVISGVPNALTSLLVTYAGKNSGSCTQRIDAWRWTTSQWVQLDSRTVGATEVTIANLTPSGALADYVSGVTGNGDVRIRVRCTRTLGGFYSSGDLLRIAYVGS